MTGPAVRGAWRGRAVLSLETPSVTAGTCAVMGTASSMAGVAEALGLSPPGTAAIPAVYADRLRAGEEAGWPGAGLCGGVLTPSRIVT